MFNISKKIGYALFAISLIVIGLWACTKKQNVADNANFFNSETHQRQFTQALENVATLSATNTSQAHAKNPDGEDIFFFDLVVDKENDNVYTENEKLVFVSDWGWGWMGFEEPPKSPKSSHKKGQYVLSCSGGSGGSWSEACSGFHCVSLAKKCIDEEGGCVQMCKAPMVFIPPKVLDKFGPIEENPEKWDKLLKEIHTNINDPLLGAEAIAKK